MMMPSRHCFFHRDSIKGWMSRDCATSCTKIPGLDASRTASALNASEYRAYALLMVLAMPHLLKS